MARNSPLYISNMYDYVKLGLIDLEGIHPYWIEPILRLNFAMDLQYPDPDVGRRCIITVGNEGGSGNAHGSFMRFPIRLLMPGNSQSSEIIPIIQLSNQYFGAHRSVMETEGEARKNGEHGFWTHTQTAMLGTVLHEILHAKMDWAINDSAFCADVAAGLSAQLEIKVTPEVLTNDDVWLKSVTVRSAILSQIGGHAARSAHELLAELGTVGLLQGEAAPPAAKTVRIAFDRNRRFDKRHYGATRIPPFMPLDLSDAALAGDRARIVLASNAHSAMETLFDALHVSPGSGRVRRALAIGDPRVGQWSSLSVLEPEPDLTVETGLQPEISPTQIRRNVALTRAPRAALGDRSVLEPYSRAGLSVLDGMHPDWQRYFDHIARELEVKCLSVDGTLNERIAITTASTVTHTDGLQRLRGQSESGWIIFNNYVFGERLDPDTAANFIEGLDRSRGMVASNTPMMTAAVQILLGQVAKSFEDWLEWSQVDFLRYIEGKDDVWAEPPTENPVAKRFGIPSYLSIVHGLLTQAVLQGDDADPVVRKTRGYFREFLGPYMDIHAAPNEHPFEPLSPLPSVDLQKGPASNKGARLSLINTLAELRETGPAPSNDYADCRDPANGPVYPELGLQSRTAAPPTLVHGFDLRLPEGASVSLDPVPLAPERTSRVERTLYLEFD